MYVLELLYGLCRVLGDTQTCLPVYLSTLHVSSCMVGSQGIDVEQLLRESTKLTLEGGETARYSHGDECVLTRDLLTFLSVLR